jgi:hypothetical protein
MPLYVEIPNTRTRATAQSTAPWSIHRDRTPVGTSGLRSQVSKLEELQPNASVQGILPNCLVSVVNSQWFGSEALELTYMDPTGKVGNELLYRHDEERFKIIEEGRPWSLTGRPALFRLVSEAQRIRLAIPGRDGDSPRLSVVSRVGRLDQRMLARTNVPQPVEGDMARLARARLLPSRLP